MDDQRLRFNRQPGQSRRKLLQLFQRERPDLVAGLAMQRELNRSVDHLPRKRPPFEVVHAVLAAGSAAAWLFEAWLCDAMYIASISLRNRSAIASRFSLPFAVSSPFSMVNASSAR